MPNLHINDIDLYYESAGQGQPILFIHGLGSSHRDWENQAAFFSKQYRVVSFDLRGHGQSQKPPGPYSMRLFASDTAGLIKQLELAPVHVVGMSLGGMIAFQLAVDNPELLKSLVIVNSGPEVVVRTLKDRWQVLMRQAIVYLMGMRKMGEVLSRRLFPKEEQAGLRQLFADRWAENDPKAYLAALQAIVNWSVAGQIGGIALPTLVLAGDEDYTPVAAKEAYVSQMPQAELVVIEDSRHGTPVDQPKMFNQAVAAFLTDEPLPDDR